MKVDSFEIWKGFEFLAPVCNPLEFPTDSDNMNSTAHQELPPLSFNKQVFADSQYDNFDPRCHPRSMYCVTASQLTVTTDHEHGARDLKQKKDAACQTTVPTGVIEHSNRREFKIKSTAVPVGERQKLRRLKATERERRRYDVLNNAFQRLKQVVPTASQHTKNVDALKMASQYILGLTQMLEESEKKELTKGT